MPTTHSNILLHVIFSTKNRFKLLDDDWRDELLAYIGGSAKEHKAVLLAAGGIEDHIRLLVRSHSWFAVADTVRLIRGKSSRWINQQNKIWRPLWMAKGLRRLLGQSISSESRR